MHLVNFLVNKFWLILNNHDHNHTFRCRGQKQGRQTDLEKSGRDHIHAKSRRSVKLSASTLTTYTPSIHNYIRSIRACSRSGGRKLFRGRGGNHKYSAGGMPGEILHGTVARNHGHCRNNHREIKYSCKITGTCDNAPPVSDGWK